MDSDAVGPKSHPTLTFAVHFARRRDMEEERERERKKKQKDAAKQHVHEAVRRLPVASSYPLSSLAIGMVSAALA